MCFVIWGKPINELFFFCEEFRIFMHEETRSNRKIMEGCHYHIFVYYRNLYSLNRLAPINWECHTQGMMPQDPAASSTPVLALETFATIKLLSWMWTLRRIQIMTQLSLWLALAGMRNWWNCYCKEELISVRICPLRLINPCH